MAHLTRPDMRRRKHALGQDLFDGLPHFAKSPRPQFGRDTLARSAAFLRGSSISVR